MAKKQELTGLHRTILDRKDLCVQQTKENMQLGLYDTESMKNHAKNRMDIAAIMLAANTALARRSNGDSREISFQKVSAYLQVGQAHNIEIAETMKHFVRYHAAHDNAMAGNLSNIIELFINEIAKDKVITPMKERILRLKNFTTEDFEYLKAHSYEVEIVRKLFNEIWPGFNIVYGTDTDIQANRTTILPAAANIVCDKNLELLLRPLLEDLYKHVSLKLIDMKTPCFECNPLINAVDKVFNFTKEYFKDLIPELKKQALLLDRYQKLFKQLRKQRTQKSIQASLIERKELEKHLKPKKTSLDKKDISGISEHIPRVDLSKNIDCTKKSLKGLQNENDPLGVFKLWMAKTGDELQSEIEKIAVRVTDYLKYATDQFNGTKKPKLESLFGKKTITEVQAELLKPLNTYPRTYVTDPVSPSKNRMKASLSEISRAITPPASPKNHENLNPKRRLFEDSEKHDPSFKRFRAESPKKIDFALKDLDPMEID